MKDCKDYRERQALGGDHERNLGPRLGGHKEETRRQSSAVHSIPRSISGMAEMIGKSCLVLRSNHLLL